MSAVVAWVLRNPKLMVGGLVLVAFMGLGWQIHGLKGDLAEARAETRVVGLRADSLNAALDTTRLVAGQFRRRAAQTAIERDSLALALDERPVVETVVYLDPPVVEEDSVEVAFNDSTAYSKFEDETLIAEVTFNLHRDPPTADWRIDIKPIQVSVGVRCGPVSSVTLVHPVEITVVSEGHEVEIEDSRVDPEMCNPLLPEKGGGGFWKGLGTGAVTVLGIVLLL